MCLPLHNPATDQRSEHLGLKGNRKNTRRTATSSNIIANSHATFVQERCLLAFRAENIHTEGYVKVLENGKDFVY